MKKFYATAFLLFRRLTLNCTQNLQKKKQWTCLHDKQVNEYNNKHQFNNNETTIFTFIDKSRWRSHAYSSSRTFIRRIMLPYKRQGKVGNESVKVQSVLCADAMCLKQIMLVLKISFINICQTIVIISYTKGHTSDALRCHIKGMAK